MYTVVPPYHHGAAPSQMPAYVMLPQAPPQMHGYPPMHQQPMPYMAPADPGMSYMMPAAPMPPSQVPMGPAIQYVQQMPMPDTAAMMRKALDDKQAVACPVCKRSFATRSQASKHYLRVHSTGDRKFKCRRCGEKSYNVLEDLTMHAKMCGRAFACGHCTFRARQKLTMRRHCRYSRHPLEDCKVIEVRALDRPEAEEEAEEGVPGTSADQSDGERTGEAGEAPAPLAPADDSSAAPVPVEDAGAPAAASEEATITVTLTM